MTDKDESQDEWIEVARGLREGEGKTVKKGGRQLAVFRLAGGRACAIDNRCPHEGYPLATGRLEGTQLTCEWHNWKFELPSGACLVGGEAVQAYETKVEGDAVFARLVDPPAAERTQGLYTSLLEAIDDEDRTWMARTVERLLAAGQSASAILAFGVEHSARRSEWGFAHGLAAAGDLVAHFADPAIDDALVLLQAYELLFDGLARRPEVPYADHLLEERDATLPDAIGREAREEAEVLAARGSLEARLAALAEAATDGFLSYGHGLIFTAQAERLLEVLGAEHEATVLACLARGLVYSTREEKLPTFRGYHRALEGRAPLTMSAGAAPLAVDAFIAAVLDGTLHEALDAVDDAIAGDVAPTTVALGLAVAAGHRLLRFDPAHEANHGVAEGWLDVTHALTYAEAAHALLTRRPSEPLLRALRYGARFVQYLAPLDRLDRAPLPEGTGDDIAGSRVGLGSAPRASRCGADRCASLAASTAPRTNIRGALDAGDEASARHVARTQPLPMLAAALHADTLSDRLVRQIFVSHHIKMVGASLRLAEAAAAVPELADHARVPLEATVRWLCHPVRERRLARAAHGAALFVREGRRPRELT